MKFKRALAFISDTHIGSRYALFPDEFTTDEGNKIIISDPQKQILDYWQEFQRACDYWGVDTVFHLGDALHGLNVKERGEGLMVSDLNDQMEACKILLKPLIKGRQFIVVSGSGYHESVDTKIHKTLAKELKGYYAGLIKNIKLKDTNRTINIAHGTGGSFVYMSTNLDREGLFIKVAEAHNKLPKIDAMFRGHIHLFEHIHLPQIHLVQLPCWVAFQPMKLTVQLYGKKQPDVGGVILLIDDEDRMIIYHYLMKNVPRIGDGLVSY